MIGLIHGLIIYYFNAQSFLITLATKYIMFGVAQIVTQNKIIACTSSDAFNFVGSGRFLGLAMPVYVFFLVAIVLTVVLTKTRYGREIYAVGGNKKASQICGIKPSRIVISTFVISSVCAAVTGVLLAAFNQQASPAAGDGYEGEVLLCIVLGVSLSAAASGR